MSIPAAGSRPSGKLGVWSLELRYGDATLAGEAAAELEELGYAAIWMPGGVGGNLTGDLDRLLRATKRATIATGVLNIWKHEPADVGAWLKALPEAARDRVLLGLGVSHQHVVGEVFKPVASMRDYLERLAAADVPPRSLCLAALGPKMVELAGERTCGVHPYLVTPDHTRTAREILGAGPLVAPEQGVILEADPVKARELGRGALAHYQNYPNYRNNWLRLGFTEDQIETLADELVDALFAWGSPQTIKERVDQHYAAGADHVCIQVITGKGLDIEAARPAWRELAAALI